MNFTTHKKLQKPLSTEKYDIAVFNKNADIIDSALHTLDLKNESQDNVLATKEELNSEITNETMRALDAESNLDSKKIDKTTVATSSDLGLVKSGTDITVDTNGNVSVNDNSHNHVIGNVEGLQSALDGKANTSHGTHVPSVCTAITDWNSAVTNGWYMGNNALNAPTISTSSNVWYFGYVISHNSDYVYQEVYQFTVSNDAKSIPKFIRAKTNGTWGAWTNVTIFPDTGGVTLTASTLAELAEKVTSYPNGSTFRLKDSNNVLGLKAGWVVFTAIYQNVYDNPYSMVLTLTVTESSDNYKAPIKLLIIGNSTNGVSIAATKKLASTDDLVDYVKFWYNYRQSYNIINENPDIPGEYNAIYSDTLDADGVFDFRLQGQSGSTIYTMSRNSLYAGTTLYSGIDLGRNSNKWQNIYATNGTIQTSDRNEKNTIEELSAENAHNFIMGLQPSTYKMNNGTSGRTHWGMISQDIEELLNNLGMSSLDFAGFIKSPKVKIEESVDENGRRHRTETVIEGEYDYSLRYDEFIAPLIKVVQEQEKRIRELESKIYESTNT